MWVFFFGCCFIVEYTSNQKNQKAEKSMYYVDGIGHYNNRYYILLFLVLTCIFNFMLI